MSWIELLEVRCHFLIYFEAKKRLTLTIRNAIENAQENLVYVALVSRRNGNVDIYKRI